MNNKTKGTWHRPIQVDVMFLFSQHTHRKQNFKNKQQTFCHKEKIYYLCTSKAITHIFCYQQIKIKKLQ